MPTTTLTDASIRIIRDRAAKRGDTRIVELCDRALSARRGMSDFVLRSIARARAELEVACGLGR